MTSEIRKFQFSSQQTTRLDHYLVTVLPDHSRAYLQGLIKGGNVCVENTIIQKTGYKLEGDQEISVTLPPPTESELIPEAIPLNLIYEDKNLIVIDKPAGMVVHPSAGHDTGTLVHAILAHVPDLEGIGGVKRPGIVHRLDKDTSGLLVIAKNDVTHRFLQAQFKQRKVEKKYFTIVDGHPPTPTGRVEAAISRDPTHRQRMAIVSDHKGRMAVSQYRTLESFSNHSLLEVDILTGRTHQIRLHMAFLECPVTGDRVYGHRNPTLPANRHLLHAHTLKITLPDHAEPTEFVAPLPNDFKTILDELRKTR